MDPRKTEKRSADEKFVGQRIHGSSEFAGGFKFTGQVAVDNVGQTGDDEQDERAQQQLGGLFLACLWRIHNQAQKDQRQNQPPDCQGVRDMLHDAFALFFRHSRRL